MCMCLHCSSCLPVRALAGGRSLVAPLGETAGFVGVDPVVADGVVVAVGDVLDCGDGLFASVEIEAAVFPAEEVAGFLFAEEFVADEGLDETLAEKFGERVE